LIIAVASGKGGTGKTTVATNLAAIAASDQVKTAYVDCDVEEPNGALFLKPKITQTLPVEVPIPRVDKEKCVLCGKCQEICQYNAILVIEKQVLVYPELCHSCGGCTLVCPSGAISEVPRELGERQIGQAEAGLDFLQGKLHIGERVTPPVIKELKRHLPPDDLIILDSPPGTSCPVVETVHGADYVLLVTVPTPFGLHDLSLAVKMLRVLQIPFGLVINQSDSEKKELMDYVQKEQLEIHLEIPHDRRIAESYSRGNLIYKDIPGLKNSFLKLLGFLKDMIE